MNNTQNPLNAAPKLLNAFQSVRPRGENKPTAAPAAKNPGRAPMKLPGSMPRVGPQRPAAPANVGRAPMKLPGSMPRVLDRNGRVNASLAPRAYGSISIEGSAAGAASAAKRAAIVKGGL